MNTQQPWPSFRVLCVDDNRDAADSTALLLHIVGFETRACYDGCTALALNESFRPGVCLIDYNMPGMNGDELAQRLREGTGWRPLILVAVTAMSIEKCLVREGSFDLHLVKPVDPKQLIILVDKLFRTTNRSRFK